MARPETRWPDNVDGRFFVDAECICCAVCVDLAPENFRESDVETHRICFKQPETAEELEACLEAAECCPVEAIGGG